MADGISLADKLATFGDFWSPRTITTFNDCDVMVVKVKGEFTWHKHDDTDDFFLVLKGKLDIELRDRTVTLGPGELYVVPKGVEHRPVAREEVHLLLIEPTGTPNTGDKATAAARKLAQRSSMPAALIPGGHQAAEAADQSSSCPHKSVPGRAAQCADGAPGVGCLQPRLHLGVLAVRPGKCRNPHQLVTREMEQALDQHELEQLADDESGRPAQDLAGCREIGCHGLDRLQDDDGHGKQGERAIRRQRSDPGAQSLQLEMPPDPARDWPRHSHEDGIHQEVDGGQDVSDGFQDSLHDELSRELKAETRA